jgi:hypothetical protein
LAGVSPKGETGDESAEARPKNIILVLPMRRGHYCLPTKVINRSYHLVHVVMYKEDFIPTLIWASLALIQAFDAQMTRNTKINFVATATF